MKEEIYRAILMMSGSALVLAVVVLLIKLMR